MSEKVLSGACDDCPMRRKINCDEAEAVMTVTHAIPYTSNAGRVLYMEVTPNDPVGYYTFEVSDNAKDPDASRLELQPLQTEVFTAKADAAAKAKQLQIDYEPRTPAYRNKIIEDIMHELGAEMAVRKAKQASLKESLAESITNCEGPEKDESAFFLRRKKCGADVLGRVIPRNVMQDRNKVARLLKQHGSVWYDVEVLGKFKPIR